ncbi:MULTISPECIES: hypothetical protein [Flavobacterium]|uniref:Uncharacterized protein n=1 Tax=Flavobacterium jumunjinense TaxID=998845 RepID=A0ABV5GS41_9FLAO|nr:MULTISPECIES: hypothetical protein [Flavobacterium]
MRKKKNLIIITVLIIGILCFCSFKYYAEKVKDKYCLTTQISSRIFDFNTFEVEVDENLKISDFKVINQNSGNTIFEKGKSRKGIVNDYGHRFFELYYKNRKEYEIGHFITDNWVTNDYKLKLSEIDGKIFPEFIITGKNASYYDFCYKRFEYNKQGKLERISFLSFDKKVYNVEEMTE